VCALERLKRITKWLKQRFGSLGLRLSDVLFLLGQFVGECVHHPPDALSGKETATLRGVLFFIGKHVVLVARSLGKTRGARRNRVAWENTWCSSQLTRCVSGWPEPDVFPW